MVKVNYTKKFTEGTLKGFEYDASISFPNRKSAQKFIDAVFLKNTKSCVGSDVYVVTKAIVVEA